MPSVVTLFDAAYPNPAVDPHDAGCLVYIGGDALHVWTDAEMAAAFGVYRLPTFVRSNPGQCNPAVDAVTVLNWLIAHKVPAGKAVVLDLEMAIDPAYVNDFGAILHSHGYLVWTYGSTSTLFSNPALDGYFAAEYTFVEHVDARCVATQWADYANYDLDDIADVAALWNPSAPTPGGSMPNLAAPVVCIVLRPQNDGYWLVGEDGGLFAFGAAPVLKNDVVGKVTPGHMVRHAVSTPSGAGLLMVASDGGVFTLGDAKFFGSIPGLHVGPSSTPLEA